MILVKVEPGQTGDDDCTFECQRCGHAESLAVSSDPMRSEMRSDLKSDLRGQLDDELTPPA
jgi:hypothetical protein